jgi:PX domain
MLDYANDHSSDRLKESALLRDLKLGVCHIDREQLRRNGLLNPRYPTDIRELSVSVDEAVLASSVPELFNSSIPSSTTLYKLRCAAVVELAEILDDNSDANSYICEGETLAATYKEEWVVYRSIKDFQAFHKHLKSEVAATEASISTGSRIVGVAAAAFSTNASDRRNRKAMIPSLAQASKTGAIAVTQKAIARRGELLGEYINYILAPNHVLNRCTEILLFIGALYPFPSEIQVTKTPFRLAGDPLGRTSFTRTGTLLRISSESPIRRSIGQSLTHANGAGHHDRLSATGRRNSDVAVFDDSSGMIESILSKVDAVPLAGTLQC